jgi:hypothetical protein
MPERANDPVATDDYSFFGKCRLKEYCDAAGGSYVQPAICFDFLRPCDKKRVCDAPEVLLSERATPS